MLQEFVQAIKDSTQDSLKGIHTAMPGKVVSFDTGTGLAVIQPAMKFRKPDGATIDYSQISGVPVVFPQGMAQGATVAFPIKAGDGGLLVIAEQSIDYWLYGQETDTDLAFDLTNAIFIPGLFAKANSVVNAACDQNAVIVDVKGSRITVKDGKVQIDATEVVINGSTTVNGNFTVKNGVVNLN